MNFRKYADIFFYFIMAEMRIGIRDGGDGGNIVDSFPVGGGVGGVNACHNGGCCRTVCCHLAHRESGEGGSRNFAVSEQNRPAEEELQTATIGSNNCTR